MLRAASLVVLLVALWTGCGGEGGDGGSAASYGTELTMVALNPNVGRAVFHLQCLPSDYVGGDLPDAGKACDALSSNPELITSPRPFTCAGGTFSWWDVTISGRLNGTPTHRSFSTCWTPQMETLGRFGLTDEALRAHLVPRREKAVLPGAPQVFPPGVLRATDLVTCDILGHHLEIGVPVEATGQPSSEGYGGANVVSVTLGVALNKDGSVSASCHQGE